MSKRESNDVKSEVSDHIPEAHAVYGPYETMLTAATNIQTYTATGTKFPTPSLVRERGTDDAVYFKDVGMSTPGILVYDWVPTLGVTDGSSATSPVNMAVGAQYSFIRANNSGARNYEAADLAIYELALDSIYGYYFALARVYGLINEYTPFNKYYPKSIVEALGFNYADMVANQVQLNMYLNNVAAKLEQYGLPATMRLFASHMALNTNIYRDGDSDTAQMYIFRQRYYWSYAGVDEVKGLSVVRPFENKSRLCTFADVVTTMDGMLSAVLTSSDVGIISGDIIKAYGNAALSVLPVIPLDYRTPIIKDDLVLTAVNNAVITTVDWESLRVTDAGAGKLRCKPVRSMKGAMLDIQAAYPATMDNHKAYRTQAARQSEFYGSVLGNLKTLNFVSATPTREEVLAAVRFRPWVENVRWGVISTPEEVDIQNTLLVADSANAGVMRAPVYEIKYCGTEIITAARVVWMGADDDYYFTLNAKTAGDATAVVSYSTAQTINSVLVASAAWTRYAIEDNAVVVEASGYWENEPEALIALASISAFDWHHPVQAAVMSHYSEQATSPLAVLRSTPLVVDVQNVAPFMEDNARSIHEARLNVQFFM